MRAAWPGVGGGIRLTNESDKSSRERVVFYPGDPVPGEYYARFVREELRRLTTLRREIREALAVEKPGFVYWSVLENGRLALLNFEDQEAAIRLADASTVRLGPYRMTIR